MLFIAEIGLNHNGNLDLCFELIRQAKYAGADIAKLQLGWRGKEGEFNYIDEESLMCITRACDYFDIEFMVSIFTSDAYALARKIPFTRYKIASRTVKDDLPLVKDIVSEGKPTIISLGMWEGGGLPITNAENVDYLWCKSKYPAFPWDITELPESWADIPHAGYSDHTIGIEVPLMAVARGAKIIEKHFTLDKSDTTIRDHALSATPQEFLQLTTLGRNISRNLDIGV